MPLLSTNDFAALGDAMKKGREITLTRTMGSTHVEARTLPLHEAWGWVMGVQIRILEGGMLHLQTFDNVGSAQQMVKEIIP